MISILIRLVSLAALAVTVTLSFSDRLEHLGGPADLRAALLVFVAPILVLGIYQKEGLDLGRLGRRLREMMKQDNEALGAELRANAEAAAGRYGYAHLIRLTENHGDAMVRYGGELVASRFGAEHVTELLANRMEAEDRQWRSAVASLAFLAKMAPYFGMLATVIGMVKLLENMNDFTKISGGMALAMQGTLYGLFSFLLLYSPLQKTLQGWREQAANRNEFVARWFARVAARSDAAFIREELRATEPGLEGDEAVVAPVRASGAPLVEGNA